MNIGDYVKYDNDLWELIYIDDVSEKKDLYFLSCRTSERINTWVSEDEEITKTNLSQSYFEL
jgi:hypothetical protein